MWWLVGVIVMMEAADMNQQVDQIEEIAVEASKDIEDASEMRREMMELGAEMTECRGTMMMMRNAFTDAMRAAEDMKRTWDLEREDLLWIQVHLMEQVRNLQAAVCDLQRDHLGGQVNPIILDSDSKGSESGEDVDVEMVAEDEISLLVQGCWWRWVEYLGDFGQGSGSV
jgi:hypothetical protein